MSFLDYTGRYDIEKNSDKFSFYFKENKMLRTPYYIVAPIYDIPFKKVFFYNDLGLGMLRDFLNSLLFPLSNAIIDLVFIPKEILSNSHIMYNKGSLIVDNACIAIIKDKKSYFNQSGKFCEKETTKDIIIDRNGKKGNRRYYYKKMF